MKFKNNLTIIVLAFAFIGGCAQQAADHDMQKPVESHITKAVAVISPTEGNNCSGTVTFTKTAKGIQVTANITGLTPGKHGFHIHEFGDCSASDGTSTGGHFNPTMMAHGAPTDSIRHSGDFGNIVADSSGVARLNWLDPMITFDGPNSIIGHGVIVHAQQDDLTSQPTGAAGARIGCGVIGIAKSN